MISCHFGQYIFKVIEKEKIILVLNSILSEYHKNNPVISLKIILYPT